jgi:predicted nucleic acid-binding protein
MPDDEFVDANIPLRILLNDLPVQHDAAAEYLRAAMGSGRRLVMIPETVSEIVFVLARKPYEYNRAELVEALESVLAFPLFFMDRAILERALEYFRRFHDEWDDCLLSAYAATHAEGRLVSYDKKISRIPGITRIEPE